MQSENSNVQISSIHVAEVKEVRGYCALCTAHCATIATVENGRVTRLDPDHDHPNGGVMCIKGKAAPELVYNPDRLELSAQAHPAQRRPRSRLAARQLGRSAR